LLVGRIHIVRCHSYRPVICGIVRVDQILQNVDVTQRVFEREVFVHFRFQCPIKSLDDCRFYVVIIRRVKMYVVSLHFGADASTISKASVARSADFVSRG